MLSRGSILFGLCFLVLSGCSTIEKSGERTVYGPEGEAEGQWRGKAFVRNLRTGQSGVLNLEIVAKEPALMRLEAVGPFGVHVASLVLNNDLVQYSLTREKRFVSAPADSRALARLVPIHLPPLTFMKVLFDRPLDSSQWKCSRDGNGALAECENLRTALLIKWETRDGASRKLRIGSSEAQVELYLEESKSKVQIRPDLFELKPSPGFRRDTISRT